MCVEYGRIGFMETKQFAQCMKRNMDARNLTTEALSELTGISVSGLEEYESGEFTAKSDEIIEIDENDHRVSKWDMY